MVDIFAPEFLNFPNGWRANLMSGYQSEKGNELCVGCYICHELSL